MIFIHSKYDLRTGAYTLNTVLYNHEHVYIEVNIWTSEWGGHTMLLEYCCSFHCNTFRSASVFVCMYIDFRKADGDDGGGFKVKNRIHLSHLFMLAVRFIQLPFPSYHYFFCPKNGTRYDGAGNMGYRIDKFIPTAQSNIKPYYDNIQYSWTHQRFSHGSINKHGNIVIHTLSEMIKRIPITSVRWTMNPIILSYISHLFEMLLIIIMQKKKENLKWKYSISKSLGQVFKQM